MPERAPWNRPRWWRLPEIQVARDVLFVTDRIVPLCCNGYIVMITIIWVNIALICGCAIDKRSANSFLFSMLYRYYVIFKMPNLAFLDSKPVTAQERKEAKRVGEFMKIVRPSAEVVSIGIRGEEGSNGIYHCLVHFSFKLQKRNLKLVILNIHLFPSPKLHKDSTKVCCHPLFCTSSLPPLSPPPYPILSLVLHHEEALATRCARQGSHCAIKYVNLYSCNVLIVSV